MIVKPSGISNNAFFVIPEDADDLFTLRRIVEKHDHVIADTNRVIKQVKEYGRPDKGERVKVRVCIRGEQSEVDAAVDRLRITGTIVETGNKLVTKGAHHSLPLEAGGSITLDRGRKWAEVQ